MKNSQRIPAITILIAILVNTLDSQQVSKSPVTSPKIVAEKPAVYLSFIKYGAWSPLRANESSKAIWLRLNNNMKWSIRFCAFGISKNEQMMFHTQDTELGLHYSVELTDPMRSFGNPKKDVLADFPVGYPVTGICNYYELGGGKYLDFRIPHEHLSKGLSIRIPFKYEWEDEHENNPKHVVYFNSADLLP